MQNKDKPYVLFADDDDELLRILTTFAEQKKWKFDTVKTARGIIEQVNKHCTQEQSCYDVLVCDVNYFNHDTQHEPSVPRLTGITAVTEIRKQFPNLPILFVTAYDSYILKEQIQNLNAELIPKPFDLDFLFHRIELAVRWGRMSFDGVERRQKKINISGNYRRSTDVRLKVPDIIDQALKEVRQSLSDHLPPNCAKQS